MLNLEKIFSKFGKDKILILILVGIILLVISIPSKSSLGSSENTSVNSGIETDNNNSYTGYAQYLENKIQDTLSKVEGIGNVTAVIALKPDSKNTSFGNDSLPEVEGVIVVAQGGANGYIQAEITEALESMLGLPANKIKVMKMS